MGPSKPLEQEVEHRAGYGAAVDRVIENYYDSENRWVPRAIDARVPLLRQKQCGNHRMALLAFGQAVAHGEATPWRAPSVSSGWIAPR